MAMNSSGGVVGGTLSIEPDGSVDNISSAVDVAMANRQFAALRGQRADEAAEQSAQDAKSRGDVARRMKKAPRAARLVTRELVLELLSNEEVARVCTAEEKAQLAEGDEYLDLAHLELGVRRGGAVAMARVLPKQAIEASTWAKIVAQLSPPARGPEVTP